MSLKLLPFSEQLNMGLPAVDTLFNSVQTYLLLALVFLLTALAFIPIGQLCGCLLERREKLSAYGLNLAGSAVGVLLMFLLSAFWTPPVVWFLPAFALLLVFHVWSRRPLLFGAVSIVFALIVLAWPADPSWQRIYPARTQARWNSLAPNRPCGAQRRPNGEVSRSPVEGTLLRLTRSTAMTLSFGYLTEPAFAPVISICESCFLRSFLCLVPSLSC
jgi:hypothetical protein